jgi:hypothetical protein
LPLGRRRGDPPPDTPCAVLLVPLGATTSEGAVRTALELADGAPVAVLGLLRIHGYSFGMPNPGLMPTAKERAAQLELVSATIGRLEAHGCEVDGQVTATRHQARAVSSVARRRGVHHVVIDQVTVSRIRRSVEGDVAASVRRRLGRGIDVVVTESARPTAPRSMG